MTVRNEPAEEIHTPTSERQRSFFGHNSASHEAGPENTEGPGEQRGRPTKWSMGVLNVPDTHEVPGSILLLANERNAPLGLRNAPATTSASSLPPQPLTPTRSRCQSMQANEPPGKKMTKDGAIILDPQPEESHNDPLNWPYWRRDAALLSLGLYCMVGGGMTPILAAGFTNVAETYDVAVPQVALTTGLYMMGLAVGSVFASPTAILWGKRPVYLISAVIFIATSIWCAASPSYNSLLVARIFQGVSVSPVECLPSATIAEIFFLHERAYRIGIYTLLLLGGKNLVPLVSAAIIQSLEWRWVFWIVAIVVGFCMALLFLFVPETFWDRTPRPKSRKASRSTTKHSFFSHGRAAAKEASTNNLTNQVDGNDETGLQRTESGGLTRPVPARPLPVHRPTRSLHVGFVPADDDSESINESLEKEHTKELSDESDTTMEKKAVEEDDLGHANPPPATENAASDHEPAASRFLQNHPRAHHQYQHLIIPAGGAPPTPGLHNFNSPFYQDLEKEGSDYLQRGRNSSPIPSFNHDGGASFPPSTVERLPPSQQYTTQLRDAPRLTFVQQLKPYNGRLHHDNWFRVAIRPFILFAYPAVLWSSIVYACAVGWLIVLSESVAVIYRSKETYGFSALSTGLIYLSPFIGGVLGTAVAGKVSDIIVRAMSKRNGGLYEPEFRLVMAAPVAVTTVIGLMGFGWSAEVHDSWIVPTIFFGIISFGCSLGSTTAITFCVDSYRQYAGEALVTLNFSKNIFHGLVFSLFFNEWLEHSGSKSVFIWLGVIQLVLMVFTIPLYIFGKRARMWTVRKNLMEKF